MGDATLFTRRPEKCSYSVMQSLASTQGSCATSVIVWTGSHGSSYWSKIGAHSSRSLVAMISSRIEMRASRLVILSTKDTNLGSSRRSVLPNAWQKTGQYRSLSIMQNRSHLPHRAWSELHK